MDCDEYLPRVTLHWCSSALLEDGIIVEELTQELEFPSNVEELAEEQQLSLIGVNQDSDAGTRAHLTAYRLLREKLRHHINIRAEPILTETQHPIGGVNWDPQSAFLGQDRRSEDEEEAGSAVSHSW